MKKYATYLGYTDRDAYEVIRVISDQTIEVRQLDAELDPSFKPEFVPGGFSAVCTNDRDQKWIFKSNPENKVYRLRRKKKQNIKGRELFGYKSLRFVLADEPYKYYDYNF
jgi:hypothetical protein